MKKLPVLLLVISQLLACNSQNNKENNTASDTAAKAQPEQAEKTTGFVLNNGAKWKADSTTLLNVALLQAIVSGAKQKSLENYIQTATKLQDGLSKMVNECKMKGADHDALHQWLEPLMEKTKELKKATTTESATAIFSEIEKHLNLFTQYFD